MLVRGAESAKHGTMAEFPRIRITSGDPAVWTQRLRNDYGCRETSLRPEGYQPVAGRPDQIGARVAWEALQAAASACKTGELEAVITGPVFKTAMAEVGFDHPGQTEFFAAAWGGEPVMAFTGGRFRVALADLACAIY